MARSKDKVALNRVLGTLALGHGERTFEDPFLHTLVNISLVYQNRSDFKEFDDEKYRRLINPRSRWRFLPSRRKS